MFKNCFDCPFCHSAKKGEMKAIRCSSNGKEVGVVEPEGFKERGQNVVITPPFWCPYNIKNNNNQI